MPGYELDGVDGFPLELFELHNLQLFGEWAYFSFSLSLLFFKKIAPLSFVDIT